MIPFQKHSPTSRDAAKSITKNTKTVLHDLLLAVLQDNPAGLTDEEMQTLVPMNPSTQRPRRIELYRALKIRPSGVKGVTRSGRTAVVWVLT